MSELELRPCPFCGGDGAPVTTRVTIGGHTEATPRHFIRCRACEAEGPWQGSEPDARAKWNKARLSGYPRGPGTPREELLIRRLARIEAALIEPGCRVERNLEATGRDDAWRANCVPTPYWFLAATPGDALEALGREMRVGLGQEDEGDE